MNNAAQSLSKTLGTRSAPAVIKLLEDFKAAKTSSSKNYETNVWACEEHRDADSLKRVGSDTICLLPKYLLKTLRVGDLETFKF